MASIDVNAGPQPDDAVSVFERHRSELRRQRLGMNILFIGAFLLALGLSIWVSRFYPDRLAAGLPRIFEYFGTIMPDLQFDVLFEGRGADGRAVPGSLTYWYSDFNVYIRLIVETIFMALTATILGATAAFLLCFPASRNLAPNSFIYIVSRRFMEICRGVPEILYALVFVFAIGIGPLAGVLAIAIHSAGALGKLFSEVNENASMRPVEGIRGVGGNWFEEIRYGVVPQVMPNFVSYTLLRFEINVRASSIVGFVGAGGIGAELNRVISLYSDDRVVAVLLLVVITVTLIDLLSEQMRTHFIGRENLQ
ncbi:phosphonate ABC transporter, permease protein PhnE [Georhizobium profundi]|jgi:phosphonate transport system permease protein|uniref:Phosphonate ABC transporter, permease protein PhnE n=1 Tax=Georhizobium profundi TaxID=2341112 RepID=A0A3Q8XML2_9HYPH|nr:phosphonate ABC transporter, permease protein PhnE [Georhizobium profundi]AZN71088.1 phosphonate ABC transporter, permease protein PhnE [Georhizobium profundi]